MDYKNFCASIEVDDESITCPKCGRKIGRLNVIFARYHPDGPKVLFGYGGCCEAADELLYELPADTALCIKTLPTVLDAMRGRLGAMRGK